LSTHIVSDVEATATQIALINKGRLVVSSSPEALLRTVEGRVWEWMVPSAELTAAKQRYRISSTIRRSDGVRVRAVSEAAPSTHAQRVAPSLEDAYLLHIAPAAAGTPA
jgi:ABC-type multidrug transport system ATPase subunit